jgi:hypothetical protein
MNVFDTEDAIMIGYLLAAVVGWVMFVWLPI